MILIGLTGGLASGKSTVAEMLRARGAVVIDADVIGHEVLAPGRSAHAAVGERFGDGVMAPDGAIDRAKLGKIVFADSEARADLEAITHPEIMAEIARRIEKERGTGRVVVLDAPLLVETLPDRGKSLGLDALVVVSLGVEDQVMRATERGMGESDARVRVAAQAPVERKLAAADYVIDNRGSQEELAASVELLWEDLAARFGREGGQAGISDPPVE